MQHEVYMQLRIFTVNSTLLQSNWTQMDTIATTVGKEKNIKTHMGIVSGRAKR